EHRRALAALGNHVSECLRHLDSLSLRTVTGPSTRPYPLSASRKRDQTEAFGRRVPASAAPAASRRAPSRMFSRLVTKLRRTWPSPAGPNSVPLRTATPRSRRNAAISLD